MSETIHVCWTEPHTEVTRRDDGERYCYRCGTRRRFVFIVRAPAGLSYYGPIREIRCGSCGAIDGDLFPGRVREWDE